jgi:hypothetical protein
MADLVQNAGYNCACEDEGTLHPDPGGLGCPGLDHQVTAGWVWDQQIAAFAAEINFSGFSGSGRLT